MALQLLSLSPAKRRDQKCGQCSPLVSAVVGTYVAMGVMLATSFALYMLLLMSPELLHRLLQDVIQCEDFPGYLSANSTAADTVEYSERTYTANCSPPESNGTTLEAGPSLELVETQPAPEKTTRVLLGIFVMAWNLKQRNLLRTIYGVQTTKDVDFTVRFVMGALEDGNAYFKPEVERDNATFGDIIVLNCTESVNDGKTFTYFSSLPSLVGSGNFDYVMKLDDDSYIRLENFVKAIKPLPRVDLYYGYSLPCGNEDPYTGYMAGAGYMISWDLVEWIGESPIPRNKSIGIEDMLTRDWFDEGGVAKNRATSFGLMYEHPDWATDKACGHELTLDSILIHKLKTVDLWHNVLAFFLTPRLDSPVNSLP